MLLAHHPRFAWLAEGVGGVAEGEGWEEEERRLQTALEAGTFTPLAELLRLTRRDLIQGDPYTIHMTQTRSLVRFLLGTKEKTLKDSFRRYMATLRRTRDDGQALAGTLGRLPLSRLQEAWQKWCQAP
jgi:hypothetical protein